MVSPKKVKPNDRITAQGHNALVDATRQADMIPKSFRDSVGVYSRGRHLTRAAESVTIDLLHFPTQHGDAKCYRWRYGWSTAEKTHELGTWTIGYAPFGDYAFNFAEIQELYYAGPAPKPLVWQEPGGIIVRAWPYEWWDGETRYTEYWFSHPNDIYREAEVPNGDIDGENKVFTLDHVAVHNTLQLYKDGQYRVLGVDYGTDIVDGVMQVTYIEAPHAGDTHYAQYLRRWGYL